MGDISTLHVRTDIDELDAWRFDPAGEAVARIRGGSRLEVPLRFVRIVPDVAPKRTLTGENAERIDTRVLQVIYALENPLPTPRPLGEEALEVVPRNRADLDPRHVAPDAQRTVRPREAPSRDDAMPPRRERADHRARVVAVRRLPEHRAVPLADRIGGEDPRRRGPTRAPRPKDPPRLQVGERRRRLERAHAFIVATSSSRLLRPSSFLGSRSPRSWRTFA